MQIQIFMQEIETREGIQNFEEIIDQCNGVLIDRGDLSRGSDRKNTSGSKNVNQFFIKEK